MANHFQWLWSKKSWLFPCRSQRSLINWIFGHLSVIGWKPFVADPPLSIQRRIATQLMLKTLKECRTMAMQRTMAKQARCTFRYWFCCSLFASKDQDSQWEPFLGAIVDSFDRMFGPTKSMVHSKRPWERDIEKVPQIPLQKQQISTNKKFKHPPIHRSPSNFSQYFSGFPTKSSHVQLPRRYFRWRHRNGCEGYGGSHDGLTCKSRSGPSVERRWCVFVPLVWNKVQIVTRLVGLSDNFW